MGSGQSVSNRGSGSSAPPAPVDAQRNSTSKTAANALRLEVDFEAVASETKQSFSESTHLLSEHLSLSSSESCDMSVSDPEIMPLDPVESRKTSEDRRSQPVKSSSRPSSMRLPKSKPKKEIFSPFKEFEIRKPGTFRVALFPQDTASRIIANMPELYERAIRRGGDEATAKCKGNVLAIKVKNAASDLSPLKRFARLLQQPKKQSRLQTPITNHTFEPLHITVLILQQAGFSDLGILDALQRDSFAELVTRGLQYRSDLKTEWNLTQQAVVELLNFGQIEMASWLLDRLSYEMNNQGMLAEAAQAIWFDGDCPLIDFARELAAETPGYKFPPAPYEDFHPFTDLLCTSLCNEEKHILAGRLCLNGIDKAGRKPSEVDDRVMEALAPMWSDDRLRNRSLEIKLSHGKHWGSMKVQGWFGRFAEIRQELAAKNLDKKI